MSKRDDKELEEIYKSIDETADKLKAVFLSEKKISKLSQVLKIFMNIFAIMQVRQ